MWIGIYLLIISKVYHNFNVLNTLETKKSPQVSKAEIK